MDVPKTAKARSKALSRGEEDDDFDEKLDECRAIWQSTGEDVTALSVRFAANNPDQFRS